MLKKYINIALVGHVANGKTTLVERLTGVCTKRDSSEKKSGRTIKLGYANCLVWKCNSCDRITTTGQEAKNESCCCSVMDIVQHISFVDAPGHHQYVHTMIKGSAVVDAAIVVTDVREMKLQTQTVEHLAILEVLDVRNILVIQNKIDLVNEEQCRKNYAMLRHELVGTVADNSPIIPISAQSGQGIEHVQKYLYQMVQKTLSTLRPFNHNIFSIIRSFDINKPNTDIDQLKGGVLGGTVRGERGYKLGDRLEIRPGLITGRKTYRILETEIQSIFSEQQKCTDMARGGLYGIGTKLDPTLTKSDRLVGCLIGRPEELPPVVTEIEMKILCMKLEQKSTKIQKGNIYQLVIGSNVVRAKAKRNNLRKTWIMELSQPVCTVERRCLIFENEGRTNHLIGFGMFDFLTPLTSEKLSKYIQTCSTLEQNFFGPIFPSNLFTIDDILEIRSFPIRQRPDWLDMDCNLVGDAIDRFETCSFRRLGEKLNSLVFGQSASNNIYQEPTEYELLLPNVDRKQREKVSIPTPQMKRENRNMIWLNMEVFCQVIHRDPSQVCTFIKQELCMDATICQSGLRLFKTKMDDLKLQTVLKKFIVGEVACQQCHGIDTAEVRDTKNRFHQIICHSCGSIRRNLDA